MSVDSNSSVEYRPIEGFSRYRIGSDGTVLACRRYSLEWKPLKPFCDKDGYLEVCLHREGKYHHRRIAHLVLEAFRGPCPEGMESCHEDGNPKNNHAYNLRWDTHKNNCADKQIHGTQQRGETHSLSRLLEAEVLEIRRLAATRELKQKDIAKKFGVCIQTVEAIVQRRHWKHI